MASLVKASLKFNTRYFYPKTIFAFFECWLISPLLWNCERFLALILLSFVFSNKVLIKGLPQVKSV